MSINTSNSSVLIESDVLSATLKDRLEEKLMGQQFVTMVEFGEGNTLRIPSIGQFIAGKDYVEGEEVKFQSPDLGEFTFTITEYDEAGFAITDKVKQDTSYASQALAKYIAEMTKALEVAVEVEILKIINDNQTAADLNSINGAAHRFVASGSNDTLTTKDLRRAKFALKKANIPLTNVVAIVDPSCEEALRTDADIQAAIRNTPQWADLITSGFSNDLNFLGSYEGIDIYTSNFLPSGISETVDSVSVTNGVANMVFSADPLVETLMFGWRQAPTAEFFRNTTRKQDEYTATQRYGTGLYRPEGAVTILTDSTQAF